MSDLFQPLIESIPCPYCTAEAGGRCVTASGVPAHYSHGTRSGPIYEVWSAGYEEGEHGVLDAIIDDSPWLDGMVERRRQEREGADQ